MASEIPRVRPCLRSGLCCKTAACAFGTWDAAAHQCRFLEVCERTADYTIYTCGQKNAIESLPPRYGAEFNPAFGAGCCMPLFNENRDTIASALRAGRVNRI